MFENKILEIIHQANIEFLEIQRIDGFNIFFKQVIKSSHLLIKLSYLILMTILIIYFFIIKIFFLSKKIEFILFKKIIKLLNKVYILKDILKFIKVYSIIYNYD